MDRPQRDSETYTMLPCRCPGRNKAPRGIPLNVGDTIVIGSVHQLQVGCEILVGLWFLALEIEVKKLQLGALLAVGAGPVRGGPVALLLATRASTSETRPPQKRLTA